ncbi:hypothetical protein [Bdellovibrio sp. HCB2-146]|uniref:hypothetical protein n=1 Tax=Bdellovibrio sp. HCB2-146 TaxID=3394362 RepID=UPI0039BD5B26
MERLLYGFIIALSLPLVGCSMDAMIAPIASDDGNTISFSKPVGEFVSSSTQYVPTNVRGYLVQASAGALVSETVQTSNVRQYKVYQNVQGRIISEDQR